MTQTMQSISHTLVEEAKSQYTASSLISAHSEEPKMEDNLNLMFSVYDSLNELYIKLERLDHVMKNKKIELENNLKEKMNASPQTETVPHIEAMI